MAEVHIIGQIVGGSGFPENNLFCRWSIQTGENLLIDSQILQTTYHEFSVGGAWRLLSGQKDGQTQIDVPERGDMAYFCHPVDVYYATRGLQGWPKFCFQIWHHDWAGRNELYGYGFCHVPTSPGFHKIEVPTWRPTGSFMEQISQAFVGGSAQLRSTDIVSSPGDRFYLQTQSMGQVHLELNIVHRNFDKFGVEC